MEKFNLYRHRNCTDTAIMPMYIVVTKEFIVAKIQWFNITGDQPRAMGLKETIRIKTENIDHWIKF